LDNETVFKYSQTVLQQLQKLDLFDNTGVNAVTFEIFSLKILEKNLSMLTQNICLKMVFKKIANSVQIAENCDPNIDNTVSTRYVACTCIRFC
jgi:hypothetical protein